MRAAARLRLPSSCREECPVDGGASDRAASPEQERRHFSIDIASHPDRCSQMVEHASDDRGIRMLTRPWIANNQPEGPRRPSIRPVSQFRVIKRINRIERSSFELTEKVALKCLYDRALQSSISIRVTTQSRDDNLRTSPVARRHSTRRLDRLRCLPSHCEWKPLERPA